MATMSHPAPLNTRKRVAFKASRPIAEKVAPPETKADNPAPSAYTRSALPVALTWFLLPALALVLLQATGWKF